MVVSLWWLVVSLFLVVPHCVLVVRTSHVWVELLLPNGDIVQGTIAIY